MIIQCEHCRTKFRIDDSRVKPWSRVRCSKCGNVFSISMEEKQPDTGSIAQSEKGKSEDKAAADEERGFNWENIRIEKEEKQSDTGSSTQSEKQSEDSIALGGEESFNWKDTNAEKEEKKGPSFDIWNFSQSIEKSAEEQETISHEQERKETPLETPSPEEQKIELKKDSVDGFDWKGLNIREEEDEPVAESSMKAEIPEPPRLFDPAHDKPSDETQGSEQNLQQDSSTILTTGLGQAQLNEEPLGIEKKEELSRFNWENFSIIKGPIEPPNPFDRVTEETKMDSLPKTPELNQKEVEKPVASIRSSDRLAVDTERLVIAKRDTSRVSSYTAPTRRARAQSIGGSVLEKISLTLLVLFILAIIMGAGLVIMVNLDLVPRDKFNGIIAFVSSKLPAKLIQASKDDKYAVVVSDYSDRWLSTRGGLIYVVSGHVTNKSKHPVNYIRIKSEFKSNGERLFDQVVYAGNVFTDGELKTLPFEEVVTRLNRRNGDINFDNPQKLAGLNYGVQSGESIPFFVVFPSKSRILGLKYNVEVEDFERASE